VLSALRFRFPTHVRDLFLCQSVQTGSGSNLVSYSVSIGVISPTKNSGGVKVTSNVHLMMMLKMSGGNLIRPHIPQWTAELLTLKLPEFNS
jgi:hypothetical protein